MSYYYTDLQHLFMHSTLVVVVLLSAQQDLSTIILTVIIVHRSAGQVNILILQHKFNFVIIK